MFMYLIKTVSLLDVFGLLKVLAYKFRCKLFEVIKALALEGKVSKCKLFATLFKNIQ